VDSSNGLDSKVSSVVGKGASSNAAGNRVSSVGGSKDFNGAGSKVDSSAVASRVVVMEEGQAGQRRTVSLRRRPAR
jgi:hypothetical protein